MSRVECSVVIYAVAELRPKLRYKNELGGSRSRLGLRKVMVYCAEEYSKGTTHDNICFKSRPFLPSSQRAIN